MSDIEFLLVLLWWCGKMSVELRLLMGSLSVLRPDDRRRDFGEMVTKKFE
jgi:hypothetical protein